MQNLKGFVFQLFSSIVFMSLVRLLCSAKKESCCSSVSFGNYYADFLPLVLIALQFYLISLKAVKSYLKQ